MANDFIQKYLLVTIMLATIDVLFALDSYTGGICNISKQAGSIYVQYICCAGLASLFFLLKGAVDKFSHLQQGNCHCTYFYRLENAGRDTLY